jgi:hypothetical protein
MWTCPECERAFANRNQQHSCVRVELSAHFRDRPAAIRQLFDSFVQAVRRNGPVRIVPTKTRIGFQVAMIFAAVTPRNMALSGHLVLAARVPDKRFFRIETISPRNHVHHFSLRSEEDIDARFQELLAEAYAVGRQEHLRAKPARHAKAAKPRD